MQIQKLSDQNIKEKKLPAKAFVIQLLDKNCNHLAFIACHHEQITSLFDSENEREASLFLEEISNFEAEILAGFFQLDDEMKQNFSGFTGDFFIKGKDSVIFYYERLAH
jgi:hypothetical protein